MYIKVLLLGNFLHLCVLNLPVFHLDQVFLVLLESPEIQRTHCHIPTAAQTTVTMKKEKCLCLFLQYC